MELFSNLTRQMKSVSRIGDFGRQLSEYFRVVCEAKQMLLQGKINKEQYDYFIDFAEHVRQSSISPKVLCKQGVRTGALIRDKVEDRFERDFNFVNLSLMEKAYPHGELWEHILPENHKTDYQDSRPEVIWDTLFEARGEFLSDLLKRHVRDLAEIGIHVLQVPETRTILFISGAGYDFYDEHWVPLYRDVLKWIP